MFDGFQVRVEEDSASEANGALQEIGSSRGRPNY